jgi:hypothetical protein
VFALFADKERRSTASTNAVNVFGWPERASRKLAGLPNWYREAVKSPSGMEVAVLFFHRPVWGFCIIPETQLSLRGSVNRPKSLGAGTIWAELLRHRTKRLYNVMR